MSTAQTIKLNITNKLIALAKRHNKNTELKLKQSSLISIKESRAIVFRAVGNWFMTIPKNAEIDMGRGISNAAIKDGRHCGMPACVGGFLGILYGTPRNGTHSSYDGTITKKCRDYKDGANAFARDLWFKDMGELRQWARENPSIWGNMYGANMFLDGFAYNEGEKIYSDETITPKAVGEKFIAVADRLENSIRKV